MCEDVNAGLVPVIIKLSSHSKDLEHYDSVSGDRYSILYSLNEGERYPNVCNAEWATIQNNKV